ncbi:hypothetical protein AVEN_192820-1 [Araneus ventricosus]|uniref:DDE-1 domain-containing protein n=1 Tax=Araneus ventricosus TaxID=182803 RepID=A0A4Y2SS90_ARAVE|nr:hypothetical protein AVEN_206826-1 [Araneus ventricosus]GBN90206.1 hypothetical protein AVEN_47721-1 [Araneus ventricosus]GBN90733.1 hypothetical protein AVEN_168520-1 [Araneus ventricosus]GBN90791.1 hypothetical protein AVEN_192820-1 [Araneus ventricosus]
MLSFLNGGETLQNFLKSYNLKTAVWSAAKAWDGIPTTTMKNAWHNLWPATIFYEDEENVDTDFKSQKKKLKFLNYLSTSSQKDKKLQKMTPLKYCIATIKPRQCVSSPMPKYAVWC